MSSSSLKRVYCGNKLVKKISKLTQKAYYMSINQFLAENFDMEGLSSDFCINFVISMRSFAALADSQKNKDTIYAKERTDELYLENLNTLSTKDIQDIIWVHEKGKLKRAPRTIESLSSELIRRSLGDSQESDLIYSTEDSDVYKPYNIETKEAASPKKRKSFKTRTRG